MKEYERFFKENALGLLPSPLGRSSCRLPSYTERADAIDVVVTAARSRYDDVLFAASLQGHFAQCGRRGLWHGLGKV